MTERKNRARALINEGWTHYNAQNTPAAIQAFFGAYSIYSELVRESDDVGFKRDLAEACNCLVIAYSQAQDYESAGKYANLGLNLRQRIAEATLDRRDQLALGHANQTVGDNSVWTNNIDMAERYYKNALDIKEALLASGSDDELIDSTADTCGRIALVLYRRGDYLGARQYYLRAADLFRSLSPASAHKVENGLAGAYMGIRHTYVSEGNFHEAERANLEVVRLRRILFERDGSIRNRLDLAGALRELGIVGFYMGDEGRALPHYRECNSLIEAVADNGSHELLHDLATSYNAYAGALERFGNKPLAVEYLTKCIRIRQYLHSRQDTPNYRHELAYAYYRMAETVRGNEGHRVIDLAIDLWASLVDQYPVYNGWLIAARNLKATM